MRFLRDTNFFVLQIYFILQLILNLKIKSLLAYVYVTLNDGSPLFGDYVSAPTGKNVSQFLGVPFAEPPIGKLRFRKPVPKQPWRNMYNATALHNACIQSSDTYFGENFYGTAMWNPNTPISEDCLYLNIYVPGEIDQERRLPVLFWIYGGGFWSGSAALDVYDGKIFATEEEVIMVTVNYRVSIFGFLYLGQEEAPGNMGLWDQLLGLRWVHSNIAKFGGDPEAITLLGESAGGVSVSMHVISPMATPYFKRAIIQSNSATAPWAIEKSQVALHRAVIVYDHMKCGNMSHETSDQWNLIEVHRCLMAATTEQLRESEWAPVMEFADFPWVPVIDGEFLVESVAASLKQGNFKQTQMLMGSNLDESIYFIVYQLGDVFPANSFFKMESGEFIRNREVWLKSISNLLPRQMLKSSLALQAIIHEYEPYESAENLLIKPSSWTDSLDKMLGDLHFTCSIVDFALAVSSHGVPTYYYMFAHRASAQTWPSWMGVLHGYEIPFIFGEPLNRKRFKYTREEQELSRRFMRYWANFARTGDPNRNPDGSLTPDSWPPYNANSMEYMNLTVKSQYLAGARRIGRGPRRKQCTFWKKIVPSLLSISADVGESYIRWKQQMDRWENEYLVNWQHEFEQYKRHQLYRRIETNGDEFSSSQKCSNH